MIRIAIVDDHKMFRQGYCMLIKMTSELQLLFDAENGVELLEKLENSEHLPDIIIMDVRMPKMNGFVTTEKIRTCFPSVRIILMSATEHKHLIQEAFRLGANGFISKNISLELLLRGVETVYHGQYFIAETKPPELIPEHRIFDNLIDLKDDGITLTDKQKKFLSLCATSLTYKEIADHMNISPKTADRYRENLFQLLNINCRVGLVLYAIHSGIITIFDQL